MFFQYKKWFFWIGVWTVVVATSFAPSTFLSRVQRASLVVQGTVEKVFSDWSMSKDQVTRLYTFTQIRMKKVLKGTWKEDVLLVRQPGGVEGENQWNVSGVASFQIGETVLLLLSDEVDEGVFHLQGLGHGKLFLKNGVIYYRDPSPKGWVRKQMAFSKLENLLRSKKRIYKKTVLQKPTLKVLKKPLFKKHAFQGKHAFSIQKSKSKSWSRWIWILGGVLMGMVFLGLFLRFYLK